MSERGFIAIARGILDHPVIGARKPLSEYEAWHWFLFEAAWKPRRVRVTNGRAAGFLLLERGQLTYSRSYLAKAWGWTEKRVRGFLFRLEKERQIVRQTGHLQTVITICNYELFQSPLSSKGQQTDQQTDRQRAGKGPETEQSNKVIDDVAGDARARDPLVPKEAFDLADQVAVIAGVDPRDPPPAWHGAGLHVSKWLREGWPKEIILVAVQSAMARKRDGAPYSIKFFEPAIASEIARQNAPLPVVKVTAPISQMQEKAYAEARKFDSDFHQRRDRRHAAIAELNAAVDANRTEGGHGGNVSPLRLVSDARRI
jgi:hypothetical protein